MINIIRKILGIRHVRSLGRGGLVYFDGKEEYYIESDNLVGWSHDIAIFYSGIKRLNSDEKMPERGQKELANIVKDWLEKNGTKVEICK
jgi:hypothetical protein